MNKHLLYILGSCLLALALISCEPSPSSSGTPGEEKAPSKHSSSTAAGETTTSGNIYIAVDETYQPIIETMVETFQDRNPKATINVLYMPGEEAIKAMVDSDSIRLVVSARNLSKDETKVLKQQGTSGKTSPLGADAIALIIPKGNKDSLLSQGQLKGIFSGEITSWKQINPESPLGDISVVFDNSKSSTVQYLRDYLMEGEDLSPAKVFAAGTNPEVIEYIGTNKNALGVIGLAWISDSDSQEAVRFKKNLTVCKLENPNPCDYPGSYFQPYQGIIKLGCYPFTRKVYVISRETRFGLGHGFLSFATSQDTGQRIILKSGLVPAFGVPRLIEFPSKAKK